MTIEAEKRQDSLLSLLGLCVRARRAILGVPMICEAMRNSKNSPVLVLEASDTSDGTHKRLTDKCTHYGVEHLRLSCDGATLAHALGKSAVLAAVAITDAGLAATVKKHME